MQPVIVVGVIWVVAFAATAAVLASHRGRSPLAWAAIGAVIGPIALAALLIARPGRCPTCDAPVKMRSNICYWCGNVITPPAAKSPQPTGDVTAADTSASTVRRRRATRHAQPIAEAVSLDEPIARPTEPAMAAVATSAANVAGSSEAPGPLVQPEKPVPALKAPPKSLPPLRLPRYPRSTIDEPSADPEVAYAREEAALEPPRILATAVYMTGSAGLLAGCRYELAVQGPRFLVLGPLDQDPTAVALERPLTNVDATGINGRLVISRADGDLEGVLVFVSVAGAPAELVADRLVALIPRHVAGAAVVDRERLGLEAPSDRG